MPVSERFQRFYMWLSIGASVISIVSAVFAGFAYVKTDTLQQLFDDTRTLELQLSLTSPINDSELQGTPVPWTGQVEIHPSADTIYKSNVTLVLTQRRIQIVPFVRPISSENLWWAQSVAAVDPKGKLSGVLNLGNNTGQGSGLQYHIVLVSLLAGTVQQGQTFADLPRGGSAESAVVTVKRVQ